MKKYFLVAFLIILSFFLGLVKTYAQTYLVKDTNFINPLREARMHIWWHWVEGEISREGISKDLESMHSKGIVQASIINVSLFKNKSFYVDKVKFDSKEWYEMFAWALKEAKRLNIQIGVHNCDGWNSSGGPWIKPAQSMKVVNWSKTIVEGKSKINKTLAKPFYRQDYYEDIATYAIPTKRTASAFAKSNPVFTLNDTATLVGMSDGCGAGGPILKWGDKLKMKLDNAITVNRIVIMAHKPFTFAPPAKVKSVYELSYSLDGKNYQKVRSVELTGVNEKFELRFPKVTGKYFKLEFTEFPWGDSWLAYELSEVELLAEGEQPLLQTSIPNLLEKTVNSKAIDNLAYSKEATSVAESIAEKQLIDLSKFVTKEGVLNWKAPNGNWEIIRIGFTTTGFTNKPATKEGEGLECDKMDTNAVNLHFSKFPRKLVNAGPEYAGNTFKFLLIDSWECAFQNWTDNMEAEFEKRRGYKLDKFLPVLCGVTINNTASTEAFLYDYRKTIAEMIEDYYYKHFTELCHRNKLEMHAEVIYGDAGFPPLDILKSNRYCDVPIFEFWAGQNDKGLFDYKPRKSVELNLQASAALFYNKNILSGEAYTANINYSASPWDLKPFGDRAFCLGINQFIIHSYVHQPTEKFPGMTLGNYGPDFNRHSPWFKYSSSWMEYQARVQQMLQKGQMHADILYYAGDQLPQFVPSNSSTEIPQGYQLHICNYDVLKNKLKVDNGKLTFGNVQFSILTLPENMGMELATLQRINELVEEGVTVFGQAPTKQLAGVKTVSNTEQFDKLVSQLWGEIDGKKITENAFGKGKVYSGLPLAEVLSKANIRPDFSTNPIDSLTFLYTHRVEQNSDIYFVFNQTNDTVKREFTFRTSRGNMQELNPINGSINNIPDKIINNGSTTIKSSLSPFESKIFVFDNDQAPKTASTPKAYAKIPLQNFSAKISFDTKGYDTIASITVDKLTSLSESKNPKIKYFSGFATYEMTFSVKKTDLKSKENIHIKIGAFGVTALLKLNGHNLGTVWTPDQSIDVTGKVSAKNELIVEVGGEYRNRVIGDLIEYGEVKTISTSANLPDLLKPNMPLKKSGLIGPIELLKENAPAKTR